MPMPLPAPLRRALLLALGDIFRDGRPADKVIEFYLKNQKKWGSRDRRQFAETVYGMVRWWRRLVVECDFSWQDFYLDWSDQHFETILNYWLDGFKSDSVPAGEMSLAEKHSFTDFLANLFEQQRPDDADFVMARLNEPARAFLRLNTLKGSTKTLLNRLAEEEIEVEVIGGQKPGEETTVALKKRTNVFISKAFHAGCFEMQDLHSQKVAPFLQVEPGQRVIDACAGAGGKTLHIAALMKNSGRIVAMDNYARKLEELTKRTQRAGVQIVETRLIDSTKIIKRQIDSADRLLLDVPCSGTGVIRRNPDTKWKFNADDEQRLRVTQSEILQSYSRMVKVGGKMVYATCSILPSENEDQVEQFLKQNGDSWELEASESPLPGAEGSDGFYMARFKRLK